MPKFLMPKFLIEVSHPSDHEGCVRAVQALLTHWICSNESHYITHSDWGCRSGVHKSWLTVEVDSEDDAMRIVPPDFRRDTKVIPLNKFTLQEIQGLVQELSGELST